ncbi:MAG TPA: hypothetical protein VN540_07485 [Clostridia bacterium]|nr:hypothetical protein [Clostridia bacterium]
MSNAVTPEMIKLLNSGDQRELRAFLTLYAKPVYDRAAAITGNETDARRVTRRVISETALLAVKGALEEDVDAQLMKLTDACCSEDLFFAKLVEETMQELAVHPAGEQDKPLPCEPLAPRAAVFAQKPAEAAPKPAEPAPRPAEPVMRPAEPAQKSAEPLAKPAESAPRPVDAAQAQRPVYVSDLAPAEEEGVPELFPEEDAEAEGKKVGPLIVVLIFSLSLITVALVWVLLVKLMWLGVIPEFDFGFAEWFNTHLFRLY